MSDATMCEDCGRWSHWPVVCPDCRVEAAGVKDSLTTHPVPPVVSEAMVADMQATIAQLTWRNERAGTALEIIENEVTRCHQCSREHEVTLSECMEAWDAENPQPAALGTTAASEVRG